MTTEKKTFHKQALHKPTTATSTPNFKPKFGSGNKEVVSLHSIFSPLFKSLKKSSIHAPPSISNLFRRWNALPSRVRLYVGASTFVVVFCADKWLTYSEKEERLRLEAEKLVKQETSIAK